MATPANKEMNLICDFVQPDSFGEKFAKQLIYQGKYNLFWFSAHKRISFYIEPVR